MDALYFTIGIITGGDAYEIGVKHSPAALKVFTAIAMLVGAAVVGIAYALLNDFVLGTRFNRLWHATRIPSRHHVIVCGLGGVGVRIVQQLRSYGHEVVAIEQDPNCRFLNAIYHKRLPVIVGDAALASTLAAANLASADALLAVTSNDTVNLTIALNAKGQAPHLATIVRYQDPHRTQMAQRLFDFDAVLSPADLVAPTFAAPALGGRVLGNGLMGDSLWVALATLITPNHPFCGQVVRRAATTAHFVPLYLEIGSDTIHGWELLDTVLQSGQVLYLTLLATQLELLWRMPAHEYRFPLVGEAH